jgi:hypothetical protein
MIAPSGLYWVTTIPDGALTVSDDGRRASLVINRLELIEQGQWPAHDAPAVAARMSYRIEWVATSEPADFVDPAKQVRFSGFRATARLEASVEVPSTGFSWTSDSLATSSASFAVIGDEANGRFFAP